MGQYYFPIILSANGGKTVGSFHAHAYGEGLKLMEHSWVGVKFVDSVIARAMYIGKPFTLVWFGDYADLSEDVIPLTLHRAFNPENNVGGIHRDYVRMFQRAKRVYEGGLYRVTPEDQAVSEYLRYAEDAVFYDTVTRQKLSMRKYVAHAIASGDEEDHIIHPLPLLTCLGNGKGGGDYWGSDKEWVGSWALHALAAFPESAGLPDPDGEWTDISDKVHFLEER